MPFHNAGCPLAFGYPDNIDEPPAFCFSISGDLPPDAQLGGVLDSHFGKRLRKRRTRLGGAPLRFGQGFFFHFTETKLDSRVTVLSSVFSLAT